MPNLWPVPAFIEPVLLNPDVAISTLGLRRDRPCGGPKATRNLP